MVLLTISLDVANQKQQISAHRTARNKIPKAYIHIFDVARFNNIVANTTVSHIIQETDSVTSGLGGFQF